MGSKIAVMTAGKLQQVGAPQAVYERPANLFVAAFIGSPPINFVRAAVSADGGSIVSNGVTITLGEAQRAALAPLKGKPVQVGIRPEDLTLEASGGGVIPATCEVREPLGNETMVHWKSAVGDIVSRVPGQVAPEVGAKASLHFVLDKLHLFDPSNEKSLAAVPVTA